MRRLMRDQATSSVTGGCHRNAGNQCQPPHPITMNIATTIKNAHNRGANRPFGAAAMIKQPAKRTDPTTIEICDDPLPSHRATCGNKYEPILGKLKLGQAIKCQPSEVGRMSGALRKWVIDKKIKGTVRSMKDYGDGKGRVWLMPLPEKAKTLKAVA